MRLSFLAPLKFSYYNELVFMFRCKKDFLVLNLNSNDFYDLDFESLKFVVQSLTNLDIDKIISESKKYSIAKINKELEKHGLNVRKVINFGTSKMAIVTKKVLNCNYLAVDYEKHKYYKFDSINEIPKIFENVFGIKLDEETFIKTYNEIDNLINNFNQKVYYSAWVASGLTKTDFYGKCDYTDVSLRNIARKIKYAKKNQSNLPAL